MGNRISTDREAGFTLIEIIIVLVVVGVAISMVSLSLSRGGRDDKLMAAGERLALTTRVLQQEAIFRAQPLGIALYSDGYEFMSLRGGQWTALDDSLLRSTELRTGFTLSTDEPVQMGGEITPDVMALPSGVTRLKSIRLGDNLSAAEVVLEPSGDAELFRVRLIAP